MSFGSRAFGVLTPQNLPYSTGIGSRSYKNVSTTMLYCDWYNWYTTTAITITTTATTVLRPFVWDYLVEPVPKETFTHSHLPDHQSTFICFLHLLWSIASSLFNLCAWQSFCTTSLQVLFGLPLGLAAFTSYFIHFFTNHCLLFTTHAHTSITCFAVVPKLCHLISDSLLTLYLELYLLP